MPRPTHRLDLYIVPEDPDARLIAEVRALYDTLVQRMVITQEGAPGVAADTLLDGGSFVRVRVDDPGTVVLYANQQGGFRVTCPVEGFAVVEGFQIGMRQWRAGGSRSMSCPCGALHPLEAVHFAPPATFGSVALVVSDITTTKVSATFRDLTLALLGPTVSILRRP